MKVRRSERGTRQSHRQCRTYVLFVCFLLLIALPLAAQSGLPFSGVPTGGLGNPPGISWSGTPTVGVSLAPPPVAPPVFPGAVPVFFGTDQPASITINNIVPAPSPQKKPERTVEDPPPTALIIEREGDTWVRRRGTTTAPGQRAPQTTAAEPQISPQGPVQPLREATLVFRDGRRQPVASYAIYSGAIYYSMPAWAPQQRVLLSALDLPATVSANREVGIAFRLPNSPNEVVTRP
ncbi:MAG TPA: hypothetical protein VD837_04410 [Terriglobales bacterium]|nr:hypothetical protein [Terriglobales bacterium]